MKIRPDVELANLTDAGCLRTDNQDYYCYVEPENDEEFNQKGRLIAVADGMGGHEGGETASRLAIEALHDAFQNASADDPCALLVQAFSAAQQSILAHGEAHPELNGMGTTCTAAILQDKQLFFGHIGDSRLYLLRNAKLQQLTEDHSLVNQLVKTGAITSDQAAVHEKKNVLTAALGMKTRPPEADFSGQPIPLAGGDVVVLASDGLHGLVSSEEIGETVAAQTPYQACRTLVETAKERGGPDNITVQILRLRPE